MNNPTTPTGHVHHDQVLLSPASLARCWSVAPATVRAQIRAYAWLQGDLPRPVWIGPGVAQGPSRGRACFVVADVHNFLDVRGAWVGVPAVPQPPLPTLQLWTARSLAAALDVSYNTMRKWAAARVWDHGGLPAPCYIGAQSHLARHTGGAGPPVGQRRWRRETVNRWVTERAAAGPSA